MQSNHSHHHNPTKVPDTWTHEEANQEEHSWDPSSPSTSTKMDLQEMDSDHLHDLDFHNMDNHRTLTHRKFQAVGIVPNQDTNSQTALNQEPWTPAQVSSSHLDYSHLL